MARDKMVCYHETDGLRFVFQLGENLSIDLKLIHMAPQTVDPSRFGLSQFPRDSEAYEIGTVNPGYTGKALWDPCEGKLLIAGVDGREGTPREYRGHTLSACIEQAYDDGAFA